MAPASGGSSMRGLMIAVVVALPLLAHAGGSNYGVAPGARPELSGKISEWPVPTPQFARDPAPGPDGAIYIAVMFGNKIARFDPRTRAFKEWDLPAGARPHGLLVGRGGQGWDTGNGRGTIGPLQPGTAKGVERKAPWGGETHKTILYDASARWF